VRRTSVPSARVTKLFRRRRFWKFMSRKACHMARRSHSKERPMKLLVHFSVVISVLFVVLFFSMLALINMNIGISFSFLNLLV
jgi:hypothetical protein